jgi:hypothetical protein
MFQPKTGPSSGKSRTKYVKESTIEMKEVSLSLSLSLSYIHNLLLTEVVYYSTSMSGCIISKY